MNVRFKSSNKTLDVAESIFKGTGLVLSSFQSVRNIEEYGNFVSYDITKVFDSLSSFYSGIGEFQTFLALGFLYWFYKDIERTGVFSYTGKNVIRIEPKLKNTACSD